MVTLSVKKDGFLYYTKIILRCPEGQFEYFMNRWGCPGWLLKKWIAPFSVKHAPRLAVRVFATRVCKPGSVLTAIYLDPGSLLGSSRLLEAVGQTFCFSTALLRDRVYSVKPMLPWAGWALTPPFHPYLAAVSLCCTCPGVTPGGRYPLSLPCGARTFLIRSLSACVRGCPTRSRKYCNPIRADCQIPLQILFRGGILLKR